MTVSREKPKNPVTTENSNLKKDTSNPSIPPTKEKALYEKVIQEATFIDGNEDELCHPDDIAWIDVSLVKSGMEVIEDWFFSYVSSTIICMVTLAVAVKPISTLLFCNNKPLDVEHYFRRFLSKCRGLLKFADHLLDPVEGKKAFYKTRKMHALAVRRLENVGNGKTLPEILVRTEEPWMQEAAEAVRKDMAKVGLNDNKQIPAEVLENLSWNAKVPFSQFGHVYFATGFFGIVWLQPQLFGMKDRDDKKMKGLLHIWAIIVKMLGLRDEFNIYIKPDPEVIDRVVREVYVHSLQTIDSVVMFLEQKVVEGINNHVPVLTVKGSLCLAMKVLGCENVDNIWKVMSVKDKFMYYVVGGVIYLGGTVTFARRFLNWGFRLLLETLFTRVLGKYV